jgi:polar amino acid transport system substrate-binding protein
MSVCSPYGRAIVYYRGIGIGAKPSWMHRALAGAIRGGSRMKPLAIVAAVATLALTWSASAQDKAAVLKELAPTGTLRVGVAVAPNAGAGNVAMNPPRGVAIDLGREMALKLDVPVEFVSYPNSGALTDAADSGAWDVAFIPVDAERKKKVAFGAAHIVLQSTYLVAPGSTIRTLADVDRPGVRVVAVENTATSRAAQASLKNVTIATVKSGGELFEMLRSGKADAIAQSRESLTALSARLPGSRVLDGAYMNSYVAVAVPRNKPAALAYASAFVEQAKASGSVRRSLDSIGLKSSVVPPAGVTP